MHALISLKALYAAACAASTEAGALLSWRRLRRDLRAPGPLCRDGRPRSFRSSRGRGARQRSYRRLDHPERDDQSRERQKSPEDFAILEGEPGKLELSLKLPDGPDLEFRAIDGTFPDWRRVIPSRTRQDGPPPLFNPDHLQRLWKAGKILGEQVVGLGYNDTSPALIEYATGDTLGVIMSMYNPVATVVRPVWASEVKGAAASVSGEAA